MAANPPTGAPAPSPADIAKALRIASALKAALDPVPAARKVLPHLAALEADLRRHALAVFSRVSTPVLIHVAQELATLPAAADNSPLHDLQSLLINELDARNRPRQQFLSSFMTEEKLQVSEGSHTDFMSMLGADAPAKPK